MNAIPATLAPLAVPIADLKPYSRNPRQGDVSAIAASLQVNGQYRPVVVNRRSGEVLAGNHTLMAAEKLGWTELAATFVDVDDEQAARIVLVDNRSNDLAGYDDRVLADLLQSLPSFEGTGYDEEALTDLLAKVTELPAALADPDAVPETPQFPVSELGDVWLLGPHRVVCGDSTDVTVIDKVMAGGKADCVWTDPPYGVAYIGKTKDALTIQNDAVDADALAQFLRESLGVALTVSKPGAAWYVTSPPGPLTQVFGQVLAELDVWRQSLVWVKDVFVLGHSDFHYRHEPVFYGWAPGAARLHPTPDRKQDTVWEISRPKASKEHPTMKPVALIERALENSTDRGDVVLDVFGGSGSTMVACHQQGRVARLVELDPRYVDVICRRYQEASGDKPVLESSGEPRDFTAS